MKHIYYIAIMAASLLAALPAMAQEENGNNQQRRSPQASRGERNEPKESDTPDLTVRAQDLNERLTQEIGNARWTRVIYRQLNLVDEQNAPLYYPTQSINGQRNLFSTIFQLLGENKIKAYEYLDGYEEFTDEHLVNFKEMLDRFHIYYEEVPGKRGEEPGFVINESDIPSADVRSLYVKEAWYFDQNNSMFDVKILAICPILTSVGDMGETTMPMFWLPYENIRPYEQERIENQLVAFEKALWFQPDTTAQAADKEETKKSKKSSRKSKDEGVKQEEAPKTKTVKAPKPERSSTPVRSVRRR